MLSHLLLSGPDSGSACAARVTLSGGPFSLLRSNKFVNVCGCSLLMWLALLHLQAARLRPGALRAVQGAHRRGPD